MTKHSRVILIVGHRTSRTSEIVKQARGIKDRTSLTPVCLILDGPPSLRSIFRRQNIALSVKPVTECLMDYYKPAHSTGRKWTANLNKVFQHKGIDLFECAKVEFMTSLCFGLGAIQAVQAAVARHQPARVIVHNDLFRIHRFALTASREAGLPTTFDWSNLEENVTVREDAGLADNLIVQTKALRKGFPGIPVRHRYEASRSRGIDRGRALVLGSVMRYQKQAAELADIVTTVSSMFDQVSVKIHPDHSVTAREFLDGQIKGLYRKGRGQKAVRITDRGQMTSLAENSDFVISQGGRTFHDLLFEGKPVVAIGKNPIGAATLSCGAIANFHVAPTAASLRPALNTIDRAAAFRYVLAGFTGNDKARH